MRAQAKLLLLAVLLALFCVEFCMAQQRRAVVAAPAPPPPSAQRVAWNTPSWLEGGIFDLDTWSNAGGTTPPGATTSTFPPAAGTGYPWINDGGTAYGGWGAPAVSYPDAAAYPPAQPMAAYPPHNASPAVHRTGAFVEVLFLHPVGVDMAHAQQQNGIGGAGTVPFGLVGVADPNHDLGFRLGGTFQLDCVSSVVASYTYFDSDVRQQVDAPDITGGGGAVGSLVHHPGALLTASSGPVGASYEIDFQTLEIRYQRSLIMHPFQQPQVPYGCNPAWCQPAAPPRGWLVGNIGVRYSNLDQSFSQTGVFGGGAAGTILTATSIDFDGYGPVVGIEGDYPIGTTEFSFYGRGSLAALVGEFRSRYTMLNSTTQALLAQSSWSDDRIVPVIEYELGLAYMTPGQRIRLSIGYLMSWWINIVSTPQFVNAVQADNYVDLSDSMAFEGLTGRAEFRW